MNLVDALLLDPSPFEIWISVRSDGARGSGTVNDPYDGSSSTKFDGIMGSLAVGTAVHLGPGTFQTAGYNGTTGWEIKARSKIHGSGYDVTTLQIASPVNGTLTVAIGHNLLNRADFCEITDLTINCALPGIGTPACGAISVAGSHIRIQRVRAINFGTLSTLVRCVVISSGGARPNSTPTPTTTDYVDCVIEDCMLDTPAQTSVRETTCLEIGAAENPSTGEIWSNRHCVIRNCYVNCIFTSNAYPTSQFQGLSLKGCIGGVAEGNKILNCTIGGPYLDDFSNTDVIIRQNNYYNVVNGAWWNLGKWSSGGGSSSLAPYVVSLNGSGTVVTATTSFAHGLRVNSAVTISGVTGGGAGIWNSTFLVTAVPSTTTFQYAMTGASGSAPGAPKYDLLSGRPLGMGISSAFTLGNNVATVVTLLAHGLVKGDLVVIEGAQGSGSAAYNGVFIVQSGSGSTFTYYMPSLPGASSDTTPRFGRLWSIARALLERNYIELKIPAGGEAQRGILLGTISGAVAGALAPPYLIGDLICRNNLIRNVGGVNGAYDTRAISIDGAQNLLVNGNVIDILSSATDPISGRPEQIWHQNCTALTFFNNTQATGTLWVGYNQKTQIENQELETDTELALITGLLEK